MYIDNATEEKLTNFFTKFPLKEYSKKAIFINDYTDPDGVFYLEEGKIRQYTMDRKGNEVTVNIFHNHAIVPFAWLTSETRNDYYYDTLIHSKLRCAPREDVLAFMQSDPQLLFELLSGVFKRLDNTYMRIVNLMSSSAYVRILHILVVQAKRKKHISKNGKDITLRLMSYDLAAYCGLSKETVSRQFKNLKDNGFAYIEQEGIRIPNLKRLEDELSRHL